MTYRKDAARDADVLGRWRMLAEQRLEYLTAAFRKRPLAALSTAKSPSSRTSGKPRSRWKPGAGCRAGGRRRSRSSASPGRCRSGSCGSGRLRRRSRSQPELELAAAGEAPAAPVVDLFALDRRSGRPREVLDQELGRAALSAAAQYVLEDASAAPRCCRSRAARSAARPRRTDRPLPGGRDRVPPPRRAAFPRSCCC